MSSSLWEMEKEAAAAGYARVAGIDEAGRGPLAGPVVAAAVILPDHFPDIGVDDSKKLTPAKRNRLYPEVYAHAVSIGIGIVDPPEIDRINILRASLLAMALAVKHLAPSSDFLLVDGTFPVPVSLPQNPLPKGDSRSISIAAASIVAKVTRDRLMEKYHLYYPEYGLDRHKGYPTKFHKEAIRRYGVSPIHRRSFKGVKEHIPP